MYRKKSSSKVINFNILGTIPYFTSKMASLMEQMQTLKIYTKKYPINIKGSSIIKVIIPKQNVRRTKKIKYYQQNQFGRNVKTNIFFIKTK